MTVERRPLRGLVGTLAPASKVLYMPRCCGTCQRVWDHFLDLISVVQSETDRVVGIDKHCRRGALGFGRPIDEVMGVCGKDVVERLLPHCDDGLNVSNEHVMWREQG